MITNSFLFFVFRSLSFIFSINSQYEEVYIIKYFKSSQVAAIHQFAYNNITLLEAVLYFKAISDVSIKKYYINLLNTCSVLKKKKKNRKFLLFRKENTFFPPRTGADKVIKRYYFCLKNNNYYIRSKNPEASFKSKCLMPFFDIVFLTQPDHDLLWSM